MGSDSRKLRSVEDVRKGAEAVGARITKATNGRAKLEWSNLDRDADAHRLTVTVGTTRQFIMFHCDRLSDYPNGEPLIEGVVLDIIDWIEAQKT